MVVTLELKRPLTPWLNLAIRASPSSFRFNLLGGTKCPFVLPWGGSKCNSVMQIDTSKTGREAIQFSWGSAGTPDDLYHTQWFRLPHREWGAII